MRKEENGDVEINLTISALDGWTVFPLPSSKPLKE